MPAFLDMRIAGEDEGADAHFLIIMDFRQNLIGGSDKRCTATGARPADAGPKMRFDIAELVGQFAGARLMADAERTCIMRPVTGTVRPRTFSLSPTRARAFSPRRVRTRLIERPAGMSARRMSGRFS